MNELLRIFAEITERFATIRQAGKDKGIRTRAEVRAWNAIADTARAHGFVMLTTNAYECLIYPEEEPNDDAPGP